MISDWIGIETRRESDLGFIYRITNLKTGQYYIGKKIFTNAIRRKPLKGYKRIRKDRKESNWKEYWGSCNKLLYDIEKIGKENFRREILFYCKSKFELAYKELEYQMHYKVLFDPLSYNEIINIRLRRKKEEKLTNKR